MYGVNYRKGVLRPGERCLSEGARHARYPPDLYMTCLSRKGVLVVGRGEGVRNLNQRHLGTGTIPEIV